MKFKHGDLVKHPKYDRTWRVLQVTQERFDTTDIDVEKSGLYAFGGMWYGTDPLDISSYGKVLELDDTFTLVTPS